jgi:hypothetical protein
MTSSKVFGTAVVRCCEVWKVDADVDRRRLGKLERRHLASASAPHYICLCLRSVAQPCGACSPPKHVLVCTHAPSRYRLGVTPGPGLEPELGLGLESRTIDNRSTGMEDGSWKLKGERARARRSETREEIRERRETHRGTDGRRVRTTPQPRRFYRRQ